MPQTTPPLQSTPPPQTTPPPFVPPVATTPPSSPLPQAAWRFSMKQQLLLGGACTGLLVAGFVVYLAAGSSEMPEKNAVAAEVDPPPSESELLQSRIDRLRTERREVEAELETLRQENESWLQQQQQLEAEVQTLEGDASEEGQSATAPRVGSSQQTTGLSINRFDSTIAALAMLRFVPVGSLLIAEANRLPASTTGPKTRLEKLADEQKALQDEIDSLHAEKKKLSREKEKSRNRSSRSGRG